jgi:enoyl-CoA hydratase/carnithine racemase
MAELLQDRRDEITAALFASEDTQEGIRAFKEKRKPVWAGR